MIWNLIKFIISSKRHAQILKLNCEDYKFLQCQNFEVDSTWMTNYFQNNKGIGCIVCSQVMGVFFPSDS